MVFGFSECIWKTFEGMLSRFLNFYIYAYNIIINSYVDVIINFLWKDGKKQANFKDHIVNILA